MADQPSFTDFLRQQGTTAAPAPELPSFTQFLQQQNAPPPVRTESGLDEARLPGPRPTTPFISPSSPGTFGAPVAPPPVAAATEATNRFTSGELRPPSSVPGMEQLGGRPPGPPPVQQPGELDPDYATPSTFVNPRTGRRGTNVAPGHADPVTNLVFDSAITGPTEMKQGVEQMSEGTGRDIAGGASHVLRGAMQTATPLMVGAGAVAPLVTGGTVLAGTALQAGSEKLLKTAGVPDEYAALGSDLIGIFGAGASLAKLRSLSKLSYTAEGNAIARRLEAAVDRAKDDSLPAGDRAAARAQADALLQGLRATEEGRPSVTTAGLARPEAAVQAGAASQEGPPATPPADEPSAPSFTEYLKSKFGELEERPRAAEAPTEGGSPAIAEGDRVRWTDPDGKVITGTARTVGGGYVGIDPDKIRLVGNSETVVAQASDVEKLPPAGHPAEDQPSNGVILAGDMGVGKQRRPEEIKPYALASDERRGAVPIDETNQPVEGGPSFTDYLKQQEAATRSGSVTFGSGLGALQPHYDAAVAALKDDVEVTKALIAKRNDALAALQQAQSTPAEKEAGQKIMQYFTGERDVWGAKVNQTIEHVRKLVPSYSEQEGLSLMRDFKNRPGELQSWLDGTHSTLTGMTDPAKLQIAQEKIQRMRPAIEKALTPTPGMQAADKVLNVLAEISLLEGRKRGFLESTITPDEYVTHLLHPKDLPAFSQLTENMGRALGGKIGRRFAYAQKRIYPTLLDAVADNVRPRTLNALTAFTIHGDKFATVRATRMLVEELKSTGVGIWDTGKVKKPKDWVEIATHAHLFQNTVSFLDKAGEPTSARQTLFVPKYIEEALRPTTDPDYTNKIAGFVSLRQWQAYTKAIQLGMSLFHLTTENYMAMSNMGAKGWWKGLRATRDSAAFLAGERRFIAHGGTTAIQGKTFEAYRSLEPGSIPTWGDIWQHLPGIHEVDKVAGKITELTFGKVQRQFKVTDFALKEAAWLAKNPHASAAQQASALQSIAKEVNAVYGGLHWENLGINRTTIGVARSIMLAPDWTLSNLANLKYATERGTPAGKAARMFWARQIVGGLAATQAMSLLLSQQPSKRLTQVYLGKDKDGQEIYQNMFFKGASGDVVNLINNVKDRGLIEGTARSAIGKAAPGLRTGMQAAFNTTFVGQPIIPKGTDPLPATIRGLGAAALDMAPIPLSGANLYNMATGPHSDRTTVPEYFTTAIAGTPPVHVPPDGTRMTKTGLRPKVEKPSRPFWDQVLGRKAPPPVRIGR